MNPYARFGLVSNSVSAAIVAGALVFLGGDLAGALLNQDAGQYQRWGAVAAALTVIVVFWLAMTEAIFPTLFRFNWVRKVILGKYYIEGTWLQAEKGPQVSRMSVIDIQPNGNTFTFSGYALDRDLEIESNILIEFSRFDWPFMTYKYRNTLSDGSDGQREGVGEVQFEMNRDASRRYNGFFQHIKHTDRVKIEGSKLRRARDVRALRSLEGREEIFEEYWALFFERSERRAAKHSQKAMLSPVPAPVVRPAAEPAATSEPAPATVQEPVFEPEFATTLAEERRGTADTPRPSDLDESIIPRRRTSDWSGGDESGPFEDDAPLDLTETTDLDAALKAAEETVDEDDVLDLGAEATIKPEGDLEAKPAPKRKTTTPATSETRNEGFDPRKSSGKVRAAGGSRRRQQDRHYD